MQSVLQGWVMELGLRHQGVICSVSRGCDTAPKDDASKLLVRAIRGLIFNSYDPNPSSFIDRPPIGEIHDRCVAFLKDCDHYPQHYVSHLMHAVEIIGYHHPLHEIQSEFAAFYFSLCKGLHVHPERKKELDARLLAGEQEFAANAEIA